MFFADCYLFCRSFVELLLSLKKEVPDGLWKEFKSSVQVKLILILRKKLGYFFKIAKPTSDSHIPSALCL